MRGFPTNKCHDDLHSDWQPPPHFDLTLTPWKCLGSHLYSHLTTECHQKGCKFDPWVRSPLLVSIPNGWPFCSHSSAAFISNSGSKWRITPGIKFLVDIGSSFHRWGSTYITTGSHLFLVEGAPHPPSQVRIFLTQGRP